MTRPPRSLVIPMLVAAVLLLLAGCGSSTAAATGVAKAGSIGRLSLPGERVHGVARNPGDGKVYLATHQGLFRYDKGVPVRVEPIVNMMGFTIAGPDRFYASGHPGAGLNLPGPVGLTETIDAGQTWLVLSRGKWFNFHALTSSHKGVLGYDGALRSSFDGEMWRQLAIAARPSSLAAAADGLRILATTASGVMLSTDQGSKWARLPAAPQLLLAAWADDATAAGVTGTGHLAVTTNAGATWTTAKATVGSAQAISASRTRRGILEVLVVTDSGIQRSLDSGASFTPLGTN
jgi:photosystem II stability/assembly factor-like uncharacterized protein